MDVGKEPNINMLSAKKISMHGITDDRWSTKDKITQYKGLLALFNRDKKIKSHDKSTFNRHQKRIYRKLSGSLANNRQKLDQAIRGDRQNIKHCLQVNERLLLAYRHLPIEKIIEHVSQDNFNLRKTLDRLIYKIKIKTHKLINLKLDISVYQDILAGIEASNSIETQSKIITAEVQDAILKQDAAIRVGVIYKEMIDFMKKDCVYFTTLLDALESDQTEQTRCMIQAVKLGQLATENLDDARREFAHMETAIKEDTSRRNRELGNIAKLRATIRREDSAMCYPGTSGFRVQQERLVHPDCFQNVFTQLQEATKTTNTSDVLSWMQKQKQQALTLRKLIQRLSGGKHELQNKLEQATVSLNCFNYGMDDEIEEYLSEGRKFEEGIKFYEERLLEARKQLTPLNDLCIKLNLALTQIDNKCDLVRGPVQLKSYSLPKREFQGDHRDCLLKKVDSIERKIELFTSDAGDLKIDYVGLSPKEGYPTLKSAGQIGNMPYEKRILKSFLGLLPTDDPQIPTREGIKEASIDIAVKGIAEEVGKR